MLRERYNILNYENLNFYGNHTVSSCSDHYVMYYFLILMQVLIDKFVKPTNAIIDYNTRYLCIISHSFCLIYLFFAWIHPKCFVFSVRLVLCYRYSGITSEMLNDVTTTLSDIQVNLSVFFSLISLKKNGSSANYRLFQFIDMPKTQIQKFYNLNLYTNWNPLKEQKHQKSLYHA